MLILCGGGGGSGGGGSGCSDGGGGGSGYKGTERKKKSVCPPLLENKSFCWCVCRLSESDLVKETKIAC